MRIAIVDDRADDRRRLCDSVCRWAANNGVPLTPPPATFESGEAIMKNFAKDQYDVIFLDIYMDGMTGMDAARAIREIVATAVSAYVDENTAKAKRVEPLETVVDDMIRELKSRHVERLRAGRCSVEHGFVFSDILNNMERVADHCSNLAICVIELQQDEYNAHEYLKHATNMNEFTEMYKEAGKRVVLRPASAA